MTDGKGQQHDHKQLTLRPLAMMVTVAVGSGVVSVNQMMMEGGGLGGIGAMIAAACLVAWPQAWCVSELGAMMPTQLGSIVWITRGLGPRFGFIYGWLAACTTLGDISTGIAVCAQIAIRLSGYADDDLPFAVYVCVRLLFLALSAAGAMLSPALIGRAISSLNVPLMITIAAGVALSLPKLSWQQLTVKTAAPYVNYGTLTATALWQMTGVIGLGTLVGDMRDPRDFIKGLSAGLTLLVGIYVCSMLIMIAQATNGYADFARPMFLLAAFNNIINGLGGVVGVLVAFTSFASLTMAYIMDSRALSGLSHLGWAPAFLGRRSEGDGVPVPAILVIAAATFPLAFFDLPTLLVVFFTLGSLGQMMPGLAQLRLRTRMPDLDRPVRVPGTYAVNALLVSVQVVGLLFVAVSNALFNTRLAVMCFGAVCIIACGTGIKHFFTPFERPAEDDGNSSSTALVMEATPLLGQAKAGGPTPEGPAESRPPPLLIDGRDTAETEDFYIVRRLTQLGECLPLAGSAAQSDDTPRKSETDSREAERKEATKDAAPR